MPQQKLKGAVKDVIKVNKQIYDTPPSLNRNISQKSHQNRQYLKKIDTDPSRAKKKSTTHQKTSCLSSVCWCLMSGGKTPQYTEVEEADGIDPTGLASSDKKKTDNGPIKETDVNENGAQHKTGTVINIYNHIPDHPKEEFRSFLDPVNNIRITPSDITPHFQSRMNP
jgi:hypothetical protein